MGTQGKPHKLLEYKKENTYLLWASQMDYAVVRPGVAFTAETDLEGPHSVN